MKKILLLAFLFIYTLSYSQTDQNGNPVFNSISTGEERVKDFQFISNYYTLDNNITNRGSSVYISKKPTLDEIENAAINLPSDFFLVLKDQAPINMVMLLNQPNRQFLVITPATGKQVEFSCSIVGDISENRANEIIKLNYDPKASINGNKLYFNNKTFSIISNKETRSAVLALIEAEKLSAGKKSNVKIPSKAELKAFVLAESKAEGKLDFFTAIKGHEMDGIQIKPGVFDTKIGIALYKWGRANFDLGVNSIEDALAIWAEHKGQQPNLREKDYITMGFNKELEK